MTRLAMAFIVLQVIVSGPVGLAQMAKEGAGAAGVILAEEYPFPGECGQVEVWGSMSCTSDDQVLIGLCRNNEPAYLLQFDDQTRRFVAAVRVDSAVDDSKWPLKQAKVHTQLLEMADGWVYGGTHCSEYGHEERYEGGHWFRYSPKSHKMEDLGLGMASEGLIAMQADAANNCLYAITYPGAYLLRFDLGQRKTQVLAKTSRTKYVDRYFQILSNGIICANEVKAGPGRMGGIFLFDLESERETVAYPVVFRRIADGSYSRDETAEAIQVYNMWIAGTQNASGSIAYISSQTSGHLISVHAVGKDSLAIYDRGDMMACVPRADLGAASSAPASQGAARAQPGFLCHAMYVDSRNDVYLTVTVGGDTEGLTGREQTHLLRYEPAGDRFDYLGRIQTKDRKDLSSSVAMAISSSGVIYLSGSTGKQRDTRLLGIDLRKSGSVGKQQVIRASASQAADKR